MARRIIKKAPQKFDLEKLIPYASLGIRFSPIWVPILMILIFATQIISPTLKKIGESSDKIKKTESIIQTVTAGKAGLAKTREELANFSERVDEFEKRLPRRLKTNLIIETLQQITSKTDLKFSSLKPSPVVRHVLKETNDVFVELPVQIKLNCGYYELIKFLSKIEMADQLMKISDLNIRNDVRNTWDHNIEFTISAFSKGGD